MKGDGKHYRAGVFQPGGLSSQSTLGLAWLGGKMGSYRGFPSFRANEARLAVDASQAILATSPADPWLKRSQQSYALQYLACFHVVPSS